MILFYIIGLTIIGIISGFAAGIIGAGAEILIVPLLTIFGLLGSLRRRIGTSLFMLLPPIGLLAAMNYYKTGHVDMKAALYMSLIFMICAYISSHYSAGLDPELVRKLFGIFTIGAGFYIFLVKEI
jgi:uncharacterized membrane protein YfcA